MTVRDFDPQDEGYLEYLDEIAHDDVVGLKRAQKSYGNSWKQRGGVGAFMMLARKWDRMENRVSRFIEAQPPMVAGAAASRPVSAYDVFAHVLADPRAEGVIDDIRDLRRYLLLVEAELRARGFDATHRDNREDS